MAKVLQFEAENARLETEKLKLETEPDVPRQVAKYFAGENELGIASNSSGTRRAPTM